jgi:putative nucleotidyltransferase with HDIG domain
MFSRFEPFPQGENKVVRHRRRRPPMGANVTYAGSMQKVQLLQYLPLSLFVTASVIVLPAALATAFIPKDNTTLMLLSTALAVAASIGVAKVEVAVWTRRPGSRDLTFADLMLWGWLHRYWADRRFARTQALYEETRNAGLTVSIELLEELSERLAARDAYTHGHNQRVARQAERIAQAMHLTPAEILKIRTAAMVHDVGKIYTPREILNNPGHLDDHEYAIVKLHAADGADMLADIGDPEIADIVRHHHEQVDGKGYPDGLAGLDIPLGARIVAVADTFDAITSSRPYRPASTHKRALDIINAHAGTQLDDVVVAAFLDSYSARRSVIWVSLAAALPQRLLVMLQTASPSIATGTGATSSSLLPALGAAGLLALSPGLHHDGANGARAGGGSADRQSGVTSGHPQVAEGPSRRLRTSSPRIVDGRHSQILDGQRHHTNQRASIRLGASERRLAKGVGGRKVGGTRGRSAPRGQERSASTSPVTVVTDGSSESALQPPGTGSPSPTSPTSPTTPSAPPKAPSLPVGEGPKSPSPPSSPPVTVPSLPVTVPQLPVSVPDIPTSISKLVGSIVKHALGNEDSQGGSSQAGEGSQGGQ